MRGSDVSPKPVSTLMRTGLAFLMFALAALYTWKGFRFEWAPWFCGGLSYLLHVSREKDEPPGAYFYKPRNIASLALMAAAIAGWGHNLYVLYSK